MKYIYLIFISLLFTNDILITTSITNNLNQPIENVNIVCGDNGTTTNKEGSFSIYCKENESIKISHINFVNKTIPVTIINKQIKLEEKILQLKTINIYGGINENILDNKIKIITKDIYKKNGITHLENVILNTPNLTYAGGTSRGQYFQIRGIGELSQFSGEGAPHYYVATVIDNINFSGIGGISLLNDIKQIEIFKGPHTSTFGTNAMAGAINIISEKPSNKTEFIINTDLGEYNTKNHSLILNKAFSDNFKARMTIVNNYTDGMYFNKFKNLSNTNSKEEKLLRLKLFYRNSNRTFYDITLYYINSNNKYDMWSPDNNGHTTYTDYQGYDKQKTNSISFKQTNKLNNYKVINILAHSKSDIIYSYDGDWGNLNYWEEEYDYYYNSPKYFSEEACTWNENNENYNPNLSCPSYYYDYDFVDYTNRKRKLITLENQLYFKNIVLGLYNSKTEEIDNRNGWLFAGNAENIFSDFDISNSAIYLKMFNTVTSQIKINLNVRHDHYKTKNTLNYSIYNWTNEEVEYFYPNDTVYKDKTKSFNINLIYKISLSNSIIFSISRGNKTGGINQSPNFPNNRYYDTDTSNNLEISFKHLSNTFSFDLNTFKISRKTPQLRLYVQHSNDPTSFDYATFNANRVNAYGFEFTSTYKISDKINILNDFSYLNSKLSTFTFNNITYGNRQSAHSPKYQYQISLLFNITENSNIRFTKTYTDKFYFDDQSENIANAYYLLNASYHISLNKIDFSIWSNNLKDTKYPIRGYTFILDPTGIEDDYISYGNRRQSGITLSYTFRK